MTKSLTKVQDRALRMIDSEGSYGQFKAHAPHYSPNWYHEEHRPGNTYVDYRTANVLIARGFAEIRYGRLIRTEAGNEYRKTHPRKDG